MSIIQMEATASTPQILFDPNRALLEMTGESYPENALAFYDPLIDALQAYLKKPGTALTIELRLSYMNTSSIKSLIDILDLAEEAHLAGKTIKVFWYHDSEDDRSLEVAEEFCEDLTLPFETVALPAQG